MAGECMLIEFKVNNWYERSQLNWFGQIKKMNKIKTGKQIYKEKVHQLKEKGRLKKVWIGEVDEIPRSE